MVDKVKVKLLRPLNGQEVGSTVEYEKADAERLAGYGAVEFKSAGSAPSNKMAQEPDNKAEPSMAMTKTELLAMARVRGVEVETDDNKADLIRKLNRG